MEITSLLKNADTIINEVNWLTSVIDIRMKLYFNTDCDYKDIFDIAAPELNSSASTYGSFIIEYNFTIEERLALILSMLPHLKPEVLDVFYTKNVSYDRYFSEFGGVKGKNFSGFLPTGETFLFIIAGGDLKNRMKTEYHFLHDSALLKNNILKLSSVETGEPRMSGMLSMNPEFLSFLTSGEFTKPDYSSDFPAKRITTALHWDELVLEPQVKMELEELKAWDQWHEAIKENDGMKRLLKPGYRSLFYGPPGTGKTLAVSLLGKATGKDVYKIDLSTIVSKYIGETEKNLATVFDMAKTKNWILFFEEADALFDKRTAINSSNDIYANQEIAYILQQIEDFPGLIIMAANLKTTIDDGFAKRFQSFIHFPMPGVVERLQLWKNIFLQHIKDTSNIDFKKIAEDHIISGGSIINVLLHCLLQAKSTGSDITEQSILESIKKELRKEGKTI